MLRFLSRTNTSKIEMKPSLLLFQNQTMLQCIYYTRSMFIHVRGARREGWESLRRRMMKQLIAYRYRPCHLGAPFETAQNLKVKVDGYEKAARLTRLLVLYIRTGNTRLRTSFTYDFSSLWTPSALTYDRDDAGLSRHLRPSFRNSYSAFLCSPLDCPLL